MGANAVTTVYNFTAGEVLTAVQMDNVNCGIPVFATTAARDAAFGGTGEKTLAEGQMCYLESPTETVQFYNGSAWVSFSGAYIDVSSTQTFAGFTKGNATVVSKYTTVGDLVHFWGVCYLGSTSSMTGPLDVTLPVAGDGGTIYFPNSAWIGDATAGSYLCSSIQIGTSVLRIVAGNSAGTYVANADISVGVPMSWAVNDVFVWNYIYKRA